MTIRFLLDEHTSPVVADRLMAHSIDAVAVASRPDLRTRPDADILEAATAEGRILVTRNIGDFIRLDAAWASTGRRHAGLLCVAHRSFPETRGAVGALTTSLSAWAVSAPEITATYAFLLSTAAEN